MPAKKKTAKKAAAKKTAAKKAPATKKAAEKKTAAKKSAAKKAAAAKKSAETKTPAAAEQASAEPRKGQNTKAKEYMLSARRRTSTPSVFKPKKNKNTPIIFTMEDVAKILESKQSKSDEEEREAAAAKKAAKKAKDSVQDEAPAVEHRNHGAASIADILGFNPAQREEQLSGTGQQKNQVRDEWKKYYDALIDLREHVRDEIDMHTADTLKRSSRDDSGDLSGYGQHMADAGTDTFDRDFALSLVSNEQEALYEIEEAIDRIFKGTYGKCEITGEAIAEERLMAVPFTRYSLEGQRQVEAQKRRKQQRTGVFSEGGDDISLGDDDEG